MGSAVSIRFTERDSIAEALAARPDLAGSLTMLHPAFGCFQNAVAVQALDGRVTLGDVAGMAEVSTSDFLAFVNGDSDLLPESGSAAELRPNWMEDVDEAVVPSLDAHPILAAGIDPFSDVNALAGTIGENGVFLLDVPFDPVPLRRFLGGRGFSGYAMKRGHRDWRIVFRRDGGDSRPNPNVGDRKDTVSECEGRIVNLDLRGLEPPRPLVTILKMIDKPGGVDEIVATFEREPLFLFPELAERGWRWIRLDDDGDGSGIRMRLIRTNPGDGA
jgi:hypothetical protein